MPPRFDQRVLYLDHRFPLGFRCACRVRIWDRPSGWPVVLLTELSDNPGASVTNTAETIVTELCRMEKVTPEAWFFEHYDRRPGGSYRTVEGFKPQFEGDQEQTFDFVSFDWEDLTASKPKWKPGSKEAFEKLIGEPMP